MNELIEFHRCWMVEVTATERGLQLYCRSPLGETWADPFPYQNPQVALTTAIQAIDQFFACQSLRHVLREFYEAENLTFGEWKQLARSLDFASRQQFTQSLS